MHTRTRPRLRRQLRLPAWLLALGAAWGGLSFDSSGADWPHYRGPHHDGTCAERILTQWPTGGPRVLWRKTLADGFGSFAVRGDRVYTALKRRIAGIPQEVFVALAADTGTELWAAALGPVAREGIAGEGDGPRSTPAVAGDRVYVLTAYLVLACLDALDGTVVWQHDLIAEYGGHGPDFEAAASPLIEGDLVLVNGPSGGTGEKLLAFHKDDGRLVWTGPGAKLTHATPVATTLLGVRQALFFTAGGLLSIQPDTGRELWRHAFTVNVPTTISPVIGGDIVYHSAGYGTGARAVRIGRSGTAWTATELWRKRGELINFLSAPVVHNGYLYGLFGDKQYGSGPLACIELATGVQQWAQPGFGTGQLLLVRDLLLVQDDDGGLVLVKPDPARYVQVARFQALRGTAWNGPAISHGRLYARTTKEAVCLDVAPAPWPKLRLAPARFGDDALRLALRAEDDSPLAADRAAQVAFEVTTDLAAQPSRWTPLALPAVLTNGWLQLELPIDPAAPQRFFRAQEPP